MKIISKKAIICILSFMIIACFLVNSCVSVYAVTLPEFPIDIDGDVEKKTWQESLREFCINGVAEAGFIACQFGAFFTGDYAQFAQNCDDFYNWLVSADGSINSEAVTYDETTDTITMDCSFLINELTSQIGLIIVPANKNAVTNASFNTAVLNAYGSDEKYMFYVFRETNYYIYVYTAELDSFYLVNEGNEIRTYGKEIPLKYVNGIIWNYYSKNVASENGSYYLGSLSEKIARNYINTLDLNYMYANRSFSYWANKGCLERFLSSSNYLGSSFGQNSTITIPVSDLEKDWEKAYNDIISELDGIREATGERPTQQQIDDAIKKIVGAIENIGGDTSGNNPGGDTSGNNPGGMDNDIDVSKLEEALEKIRAAIADVGGTNENLAGMKEVMASMERILAEINNGKASQNEILSDIYDLLEKMYKLQKIGLALEITDLITDFLELLDTGDSSIIDEIGTSLSNVANASQEHFPTSIPWDLIAVFTVFNVEASAPVYELPFCVSSLGIEESIFIDLSVFEQLSRISRALLSILFVLLLIHLTRKTTAPDEGGG